MKSINFSVFFLYCLVFCSLPSVSTTAQLTKKEVNSEQMQVGVSDEDIPIPRRRKTAKLKNNIQMIEIQGDIYDRDIPIPKRKKIISQPKLPDNVEFIVDSIQKKLAKCWKVPDGISYKKNFSIKINILLSPQGEVVMANIVDNNSYQNNAFFRSVADNAMRAVYKCSPFTDLPSTHYHIWREITLDFILND